MTTVVLITRHGHSEHNLNQQVFMGRAPESRLTELGRRQARLLGARLAGPASPRCIVASSLPRAMETAWLIARQVGLNGVHAEDDFWELSKGDWEGRMPRELPAEVRREIAAAPMDYRFGGGESFRDVLRRIRPAFESWVASHQGERVLFVLHGDVIHALLQHLIGFPEQRIQDFAVDPCGLCEFHLEDGHCRVIRINDSGHLEPDAALHIP